MVFLNAWILFGLIPLYFIYKKHSNYDTSRQTKLLHASLLFMLLAIAQPVLKHSLSQEKFNSQDYIIALDASYSMQADDLKPTRYEMAKKAIKKLLSLHKKDRFTLFAFTSNALLISPPTTDTSISLQALNTLNPNYILTKSTNLYNLFKTISKTSFKKKNLIVFSDGGDEQNIERLATLLKKSNITPYFVATATQKGAALKRDGKYLKNIHSSLVISKINPLLKDLASLSDGKYYELHSLDIINRLSDDITEQANDKQGEVAVQSYKELYFIPLLIAFFLFFISVTKLHQLYIFLPLLFLPYRVDAGLLDFYYLSEANSHFKEAKYKDAAVNFKHLEPSVKSYYNLANSLYKAGEYKNALRYYTRIRTAHKRMKQAIFYNMGNCALKLKKYDKARKFYIYALVLGEDRDALYNLNLIRNLKTTKNPSMPKMQKNSQQQKKSVQSKQKNKKKSANSKSNSSKGSNKSSNGAGGDKKKKQVGSRIKKKDHKKSNYKIGYKAYEIINKGYADEKEPW
jgi:Ca-activated chloride channel family protein